jgi:ribonuclease HI
VRRTYISKLLRVVEELRLDRHKRDMIMSTEMDTSYQAELEALVQALETIDNYRPVYRQ